MPVLPECASPPSSLQPPGISPLNASEGRHPLQETTGWPFQRALRYSFGLHGAIVLLALLSAILLSLQPPVPPAEERLYTLVIHPAKTPPSHADAHGAQAQQAGGQKRHQADPVKPRLKAVEEPFHPTVSPPDPVRPRHQALAHPQPQAHTPATVLSEPPVMAVATETPSSPADNPPDEKVDHRPTSISIPPVPETTAASQGGEPTPQLAVSPDAMAPYFKDLKLRLSQNWHPPRGDSSLRVVVLFTVEQDGAVSDVKIQESSGDASVDDAALAAVRQAAPLESLPADWKVPRIPILFTFDYTVFGKRRVTGRS